MDGLLLIDKPSGPTSHDVVARLRKTSGERRIGHSGTLDPRASGLLPLVLGRATRLAAFLTAADKTYDATIALGVTTDTDDAAGVPIREWTGALPARADVDAALEAFRGTILQTPPRHSAKRIGGEKAYDLARRDQPFELKPVSVTVRAIDRTGGEGALVEVRVVASSGFYVRALARDLGERLGCGAHLVALRRTRSGVFDVANAIPIDVAERLGPDIEARLLPAADALPDCPRVTANETGLKRVLHGNPLGPEHLVAHWVPSSGEARHVRILGPDGRLLAVANSRGGLLHPIIVLG